MNTYDENVSLSEIFNINPEDYADVSVQTLSLSARVLNRLYQSKIFTVKDLMQTDISIDDEFNIHVFRSEEISGKKIKNIISASSGDQFISNFGEQALKHLVSQYGDISFGKKNSNIKDEDVLMLPTEIDKDSFSNGEKQIFIMALYYSLVQLGNHEIPFVIDTPYARIDTEHRQNIARHFFSKLKGQVFILSTNEEITGEHIQILQNKILSRYMLENTDNKKTVIIKDTYFEA